MRKRRLLRAEHLECRRLLAGDVEAMINGSGDLVITGDAESNQIQITQNLVGDITIAGLNGTTIDGSASQTFLAANLLSGNISANMGAGNDEVTVLDVDISGELSITGEAGAEAIAITGGSFGTVSLNLGEGANVSALSDVSIASDLTVLGGGGIDASTILGGDVGGNVLLDLGANSNSVHAGADLAVDGTLTVTALNGADVVTLDQIQVQSDVLLILKGGANEVAVTDSELGGSLRLSTTTGADDVAVSGVSVAGDLLLWLRDGGNTVSVADVAVANDMQVVLTAGNDSVAIADAQVGADLLLRTGAGNDVVVISNGTQVVGSAIVDLGDNDDQIGISGALFGSLKMEGREGTLEAVVENTIVIFTAVIRGGASVDHVFADSATSVGGSLVVQTYAGDDVVRVNGATTDLNLRLILGAGADVAAVQNTRVRGSLSIEGGDDDDQLLVQSTFVRGNAAVEAGAGEDEILLNSNLWVGGDLSVNGGVGIDEIAGDLFARIVAGSKLSASIESQATNLIAADFDFMATLIANLRADLGL